MKALKNLETIKKELSKTCKRKKYKIILESCRFGGFKILRIITNFLEKKHIMEKSMKFDKILRPLLTEKEVDKIFYLSVMSFEEWKNYLVLHGGQHGKFIHI